MRSTTKEWCARNGSKLLRLGWREWAWVGVARVVYCQYLVATEGFHWLTFTSRKNAERTLDQALHWWREVGR